MTTTLQYYCLYIVASPSPPIDSIIHKSQAVECPCSRTKPKAPIPKCETRRVLWIENGLCLTYYRQGLSSRRAGDQQQQFGNFASLHVCTVAFERITLTYKYHGSFSASRWHRNLHQDGAWEQQITSTEFTPEEWQWVQDPGAEGYYYNSVTVSSPSTPNRIPTPHSPPTHEFMYYS